MYWKVYWQSKVASTILSLPSQNNVAYTTRNGVVAGLCTGLRCVETWQEVGMPEIYLSTNQIDPDARNDFWRTLIRPIYEISSFDGNTDTSLEGEIWSYSSGPLTIGATRFNQQRYHRDRKLISLGGLDFYLIQLITAGDLKGDFAGNDVKAVVGDIVIIDLSYAVHSAATAGRRITTTLPREALNNIVNRSTIHGTVLPGHAATTRLIAHFLKGVLKIASGLTPEEGASTQEAMVNLFAMALRNVELASICSDWPTLNRGLKEAIVNYIDQNITSNRLNVNAIQTRFNISRAHLYRLFEEENGISGLIKNKRLNLALRALSARERQNISIKQIAYQFGFESPAAFNRLFRDRYGALPRELIGAGDALTLPTDGEFSLHAHIKEQVLNVSEMINKSASKRNGFQN